jgi:hypothetical protein
MAAQRPPNGFAAWQATLGYIRKHHSPDALLKLHMVPTEAGARWSASVSWGGAGEQVERMPTFAAALQALWREVDNHHEVFLSAAEAFRQPGGYQEHDWLDLPTQDILHRLMWTTRGVFLLDWALVIVYQPIADPLMRVQMRLLAQENTVQVGGRGSTLLDAARDLYRHAAPVYLRHIDDVTAHSPQF